MPARRARVHAAALIGYVSVAVVFAWPLPLQMATALFGSPGGDTGVYVWNLWAFSHEILSHSTFPFLTREILYATPAVPLTLHNYTTAANVAALPLLPLVGTIATFNLLVLASSVLSAHLMFVFLRAQLSDPPAAWLGGLLYGFSPYMICAADGAFQSGAGGAAAALRAVAALPGHRVAHAGACDRPRRRAGLGVPVGSVLRRLLRGDGGIPRRLAGDRGRAALRRHARYASRQTPASPWPRCSSS